MKRLLPMLPLPVLALLLLAAPASAAIETSAAAEPSWQKAVAEIAARSRAPGARARARNVILFVGDGMGITTITAARIFEAQRAHATSSGATPPGANGGSPPPDSKGGSTPPAPFEGGEENLLAFEKLPARALVKTYNSNAQVPDSAGTGTAMTTGTKTRIGVLGLLPGQGPATCATPARFPATLARLARDRGMGVGIVTTTRITHATPAAMFAHTPARDWEAADRDFPAAARAFGCPDIASQLVAFPGGMDVVLGGGLARFRAEAAGGTRDDGRDLVAEWQGRNLGGRFLDSAAALRALDPASPGPVLGLFAASHLAFNADADRSREPSLAELAGFAVRKLQAQAKARAGARRQGYVLMVEGGRIDHAHHNSNAYRALDETVEFARAVEAVLALVDLKDTLVLVTADHSHVFTMAGYPPRGNDILGYLRPIEGGEGRPQVDAAGNVTDRAGRPMPTLGYANGPPRVGFDGKLLDGNRPPADRDYLQPKTFDLASETHGGDDVALYGAGPGSALVSGTLEQNSIFHIIARALGWR